MAITINGTYTYTKPLDTVYVDSEGNVIDPDVPSARGTIQLPEVTVVTPDLKEFVGRYNIASNDALRVTGLRPYNTHLIKQVEEGAAKYAAWAKENPGLETIGLITGAAPLAVAATPAIVGGGELAYPILTNPYVDKGIASAFAGHGLNHWINEGINGYGDAFMTALELTPLGRVAKPIWNTSKETFDVGKKYATDYYRGYKNVRDSQRYMRNITGDSNIPNRFSVFGDHYVPAFLFKKRTPQITAENAASITPEQWTAAQDAAIARGDMTEAQRLSDLHASVNGYNPSLSLYHGSPETFNEFEAIPNFGGYVDYHSHFSTNPTTASKFGDVRQFYTNVKAPLRVTDQGVVWDPLNLARELGVQPKGGKHPLEPYWREFRNKGRSMYKEANRKFMEEELGGDAYIYDNVVEGGGDSYAIPTSRQVKLADAVTYDPVTGKRIPLGERHNFSKNDVMYYESPNKKALKGVNYIEQTPSATSLDAEQQLAQRLESYTPRVGENGLVKYKPLNSSDAINIPEEAIEKQIQRFVDSGMTREDAIEYLREQFGYGAMTQNGKTFLLPEKYMITNPEYMKAHDAIHRVLRFDDSFNIPGAEGLNPNEAVAMISGEIKPALGVQANEPLTEELLNKWLKTTDNRITGRYGFSSKIKDKKKFLEWVNKVAPVMLPWFLGGIYGKQEY